MILYLKNLKTGKNQPFEINVSGVLNSNDLLVAIIDETTCHLLNNVESDIYTQIHLRKIHHIVFGNFKFEDKQVYCKIAFIISPECDILATSDPFVPIILNLVGGDGDSVPLESDYELYDIYFKNMYIFNYKEYSEYCDMISVPKLNIKEYLISLVKRKINNNTFNSYQLSPKAILDSSKFISNEEFNKWLDGQEAYKTTVVKI